MYALYQLTYFVPAFLNQQVKTGGGFTSSKSDAHARRLNTQEKMGIQ